MEVSADISLPAKDATQRERAKMRLYVLCQTCGWGLFMAIEVWQMLVFPDHESKWSLGTSLAVTVMTFSTALLLTHFMRPLMERWKWKELGWKPLLPRLVTMAFVGAGVWNCLEILWVHGALGLPWNTKYSLTMVVCMEEFSCAVLFFLWLCMYFFYHLFDRLNRSEIERFKLMTSVKEAQLRALKSQVNPHFIFNSLNSLRALIDEEPERARMAVTQLANLLRYSLQSGQLETVPFEDELGIVNDYLALEQVRHEERLRLRLDIAPEALKLPVPPMLLQTLVENAVKFGITPRPEGGEIAIIARSSNGELRIQVMNPGEIGQGGKATSTGLGLRNAAERLRLIFGERATLSVHPGGREQVVAEAVIPLPSHT